MTVPCFECKKIHGIGEVTIVNEARELPGLGMLLQDAYWYVQGYRVLASNYFLEHLVLVRLR